MFFKLLHKIRQKPEATRQLITLGLSIFITVAIAGAWAMSFLPQAHFVLSNAKIEDLAGPFSKISEKISAPPAATPMLWQETAAVGASDGMASGTPSLAASSTASGTASSMGENGAGTSSKNLLK